MIKWKILFQWILLLQLSNVAGIWRKWLPHLCILTLSIHLKVVSVVVESVMCKNVLICRNTSTYTVTKKKYFIKAELNGNINNIIYLTFCKLYSEQYYRSANFKNMFWRRKSDIRTKKIMVQHGILTICVVIHMIWWISFRLNNWADDNEDLKQLLCLDYILWNVKIVVEKIYCLIKL